MSSVHLQLLLDLNRAHALISRRFDAELGSVHGIGLADLQLLHALAQAPGQRLRRGELAQQLGVTPSGVTWMLRPLSKRRLVASEGSSEDARVTYAVLTAGGRALVDDALPSARQLAAELVGAQLGKAEAARVADAIARLAQPA
jgi:DNA-binding MarR family transcriptional regulator